MTSIHSMTGYGKAEFYTEHLSIQVELKSVNNRFLDIQFRTPKQINLLETKIRGILEEYFTRGSISCHIQLEMSNGKEGKLQLEKKVLEQYEEILQTMQSTLPVPTTIDLGTLLKNPDLITYQQPEQDIDAIWPHLESTIQEACNQLKDMRKQEGMSLKKDIHSRLSEIQTHLKTINEHLPKRQEECEHKLRTQVQEWMQEAQVQEERILTELGVLAEKMDVSEEVVRFSAHIELFIDTIQGHQNPGKRLGFILQEMVREANTLSTKALYSPIQHLCVYIKEELEKIREQTLNME